MHQRLLFKQNMITGYTLNIKGVKLKPCRLILCYFYFKSDITQFYRYLRRNQVYRVRYLSLICKITNLIKQARPGCMWQHASDMEIVADPRNWVPSRILAWQQASSNDSRTCHKLYCHRQKAYCLTLLIPILSAIYFLINKKPTARQQVYSTISHTLHKLYYFR